MGIEIAYVDAIEERKKKVLNSVDDYTHIASLSDEDKMVLKNVASYDARHNKAYGKSLESIDAELKELEGHRIYRSARTKQKIQEVITDKALDIKRKPNDTGPIAEGPRKSVNKAEHSSRLKSITADRKLKASFEKIVMKYYRGVKRVQLINSPNRRAKEGMRAKFKHFENSVIKNGIAFGSETFISEIESEFPNLVWELAPSDALGGKEVLVENVTEELDEETGEVDFSIETKGPAQLREEAKAGGVGAATSQKGDAKKLAVSEENKESSGESKEKEEVKKGEGKGKGEASNDGGKVKAAKPSAATVPLKISKPESTEAKIETTSTSTQALPKTSEELNKNSKAQYEKSIDKITSTSSQVQKTKDAKTKSGEAIKAVTPPIEEAIGEANTATIVKVADEPAPQTDSQKPKESVKGNIESKLPKTEADVKKLKESNLAEQSAQEMNALIKGQTGKIKSNYEKIKEKKAPVQKTAEESLPGSEPAPPISQLNLSDELVPSASPDQSDFSEYSKATDDLVKNELQTPELIKAFETSDAQPMVEARAESTGIKTDAQKAPEETKAIEQSAQSEFKKGVDTEEKTAVDQMLKEREQELKNVEGLQKDSKSKHEKERKRVSDHINQIYETANSQINHKLEVLELKSTKTFEEGQTLAFDAFQKGIALDLEAFFEERHSGVSGFFTSIGDWWSGTDDLPEVQAIFNNNKEKFVATIDQLVNTVTAESEQVIEECKDILAGSRQQIAEYVEGLSPELQKFGETCQSDINEKLDKLQEKTAKAETALKDKLAELREKAIAKADEHIETQKEKMQGKLSAFGNLVLDLAMKFFTFTLTAAGMDPTEVMKMINKGVKTLTSVITNPMGFFANLGSAVGQGIGGFQANFKKHIMTGMLQWLTGAVGGAIELPSSFDAKGVITMGFSTLGLTWTNLREKIVKHVGEPVMGAAEKGFELINVVRTDGVSGLWEHLQAEAESIKSTVIEGIKDWALMTIVKKAVIKIALMLNPAGAIVTAITSIYNLVMWLVNNMQRIITFVNSVVNSITSIAAGQIGAAAGFIQNAMATAIPMIMSGLARFLGLGGISKKIKEVVNKVRAPIDKAVDKGVKVISKKAKKWFGKKKNKPDNEKKGKDKDKDDDDGKVIKLKPEPFKMAGKKHTLTFEGSKVMMASVKGSLTSKLASAKKEVEDNRDAENLKGKADHVLKSLVGLTSAVNNTTKSMAAAEKSKDAKKMAKAQKSLDKLAANIGKFGTKYGLKDLADITSDEEIEYPTYSFKYKGVTYVSEVDENQERLYVSNSTDAIKDFLKTLKQDYPDKLSLIEEAEEYIKSHADPIISKIETGDGVREKLLQDLLLKMTEVSNIVKKILKKNELSLKEAREKYNLEGITGIYKNMPTPKGDDITPDHMPQAALFKELADTQEFDDNVEMQNRAKGAHAQGAYTINVQDSRHKAGRTWGSKGDGTKGSFITRYLAEWSKIDDNDSVSDKDQAKRDKAIDMLAEELKMDVQIMRAVYNTGGSNPVWKDLDEYVSGTDKDELVIEIKGRVKSGLNQMLNQPINVLRKES